MTTLTKMHSALIAVAAASLMAGCASTKLDADVPPAGNAASTLAKPDRKSTV